MEDLIVEGYAIVYNATTLLYEYEGKKIYEVIDNRALDGCDISDVVLRYNHSDQVFALASTKNGTLKLTNDSRGLKIRAKLANTTVGRDVYEMIKEKLCSKMSFAFIIEDDEFDMSTGLRTIKKIKRLIDASVVDMPAYPQTSICVVNEDHMRNEKEVTALREQIRENDLKHEKKLLKRKTEMQEVESLRRQIEAKGN